MKVYKLFSDKMILVDAVHIQNDGGKVLLDYLIEKLEQTTLPIHYLLDDRIENNHPLIKPSNQVSYLKGGILPRYFFYRKHKNAFTKVLCFANIPPIVKLNATVYTYFHQLQFLKVPRELNLKSRILFNVKIFVLRQLIAHTNFWIVQSDEVKSQLINKFKIKGDCVKVEPFYPPLVEKSFSQRKKNTFVYVSSGFAHKNHVKLIRAFFLFYDQHKVGELHLTIGSSYVELLELIRFGQENGYPIINHGFIERKKLNEIYQSAEFAIYPSLTESFGMGIIEAIENGCKIIGADRSYMFAVCEPSLVFDPLSEAEMVAAMTEAVFKETMPSKQLIFNEIDKLMDHLNIEI